LQALQAQRLPLLDSTTDSAIAVIHKSLIDSYLAKREAAGTFAMASLQDLLYDPEAGKQPRTPLPPFRIPRLLRMPMTRPLDKANWLDHHRFQHLLEVDSTPLLA
jgi:hypothetical protein